MENIGFRFFDGVIDAVWMMHWPLLAVFVVFMGLQLRGFRPGERLQALLMFLYFFLVIVSFWILKPLKKGLFIGYYTDVGGLDLGSWHLQGPQAELIAKILNMLVAGVAVAVFTLLARSLRREQLTYVNAAFFAVAYVLYSFILDSASDLTVWSFYLFGDLFSTVMVATFFAFLNDSVEPGAAKRLYGFIGLGGVIGGAFGSMVVAGNVDTMTSGSWMQVCLGLVVAIAVISMVAGREVRRRAPAEATIPHESGTTADKADEEKPPNAALEGARLALRSPYLLSIVAIVGLYEMVSTIMDFQLTSAGVHYLGGEFKIFISKVYAFSNLVAAVVQLFLTSYVMTRFGVGAALLFLPVASLMGSVGFLAVPALLMGGLLNTADSGFSYGINQSAKEVLYVPTTRDEKYKAKAFIDMFVQRFAKALAVVLALALSTAVTGIGGLRLLSFITMAILILWIWAVRYAGGAFAEKEAAAGARAAP